MIVYFGIVLYKKALKYTKELIESINLQDSNDFKLLIINDDIDLRDLQCVLTLIKKEYTVISYSRHYSPVELRILLLHEAKERNADLLVIGDSDDVFSYDRVSKVIKSSQINPGVTFFYNEIVDFSGMSMLPKLPEITNNIENIALFNYLGLSNASLRVKDLSDRFIDSLYECDNPIFDWYFFSRLLLDGKEGVFVPEAKTFYRLHDDNLVGDQSINSRIIEYELEVKMRHYKLLQDRSIIIERLYWNYLGGKYTVKDIFCKHFWWGYTDSTY